MQATRLSVAIALGLVYVVWGSTYLAIRYAVETLPPFSMAGVRFVVAGGLLYAWARLRGAPRPRRSHWGTAAVVGLLLLLGGNGGVVWSEQFIDSSLAALLVTTTSLWMVLLEWGARGRRPRVGVMAGVVSGFVGVAVLVGPRSLDGSAALGPSLVVMGSAFCWALGSVYGKGAEKPSSPLLGAGMEMLVGGAGLLLLGLVVGEPWRIAWEEVSAASVWGLVYLIGAGSLVGFTAYSWLLRHAPISVVSTYAYVNPVVAVWLGWALAGEALSARTGVASAIIVGSVALITTLQKARRDRPSLSLEEESISRGAQ